MKVFSVWVGGLEVNEYYLSIESALKLIDEYVEKGYDDIELEYVGDADEDYKEDIKTDANV